MKPPEVLGLAKPSSHFANSLSLSWRGGLRACPFWQGCVRLSTLGSLALHGVIHDWHFLKLIILRNCRFMSLSTRPVGMVLRSGTLHDKSEARILRVPMIGGGCSPKFSQNSK